NTNVADGISSLTRIDPDGTRHTEFSNGEQLVIKSILIDPSTGKPVDLSGTLSNGSTAIGAVGSAIERGGKALPTGRHHAGPSVSKGAAEKAIKIGTRWGAVGYALEAGSGLIAIFREGAPVPETLGESTGTMAGGWGGAWAGAAIGGSVGGPVGAVVGGAVGAVIGSGVGGKIGKGLGGLGRKLFGG
ncbi:hypothetical protein LQ419_20320, partial [Gordonia paraffinivorans]